MIKEETIVVKLLLVAYIIFFFLMAYILSGLINKIGFTFFGFYTIYLLYEEG